MLTMNHFSFNTCYHMYFKISADKIIIIHEIIITDFTCLKSLNKLLNIFLIHEEH